MQDLYQVRSQHGTFSFELPLMVHHAASLFSTLKPGTSVSKPDPLTRCAYPDPPSQDPGLKLTRNLKHAGPGLFLNI